MGKVEGGVNRRSRRGSRRASEMLDEPTRLLLYLIRKVKSRMDAIQHVWKARLDALYWLLDGIEQGLKAIGDALLQNLPMQPCSFWEYFESLLQSMESVLAPLALFQDKRTKTREARSGAQVQLVHLLAAADRANARFDRIVQAVAPRARRVSSRSGLCRSVAE